MRTSSIWWLSIGVLATAGLSYFYLSNFYVDYSFSVTQVLIYSFPIGLLIIASAYLNGLTLDILSKVFGVKIRESFDLSLSASFYNLISPFRGGLAIRAVYLKKRYNLTYSDFAATLAASYVIIFFVAGLAGLLAALALFWSSGVVSWILVLVLSGTVISMLSIIIFSPQLKPSNNKWVNRFVKAVNSWHLIRRDKGLLFRISVLSLAQLVIGVGMLWLQFAAFGVMLNLPQVVLLTTISTVAVVIAVTPAGLGINEAVAVFSAAAIGITPAESLSAVVLGRIISVAILFVLGPICTYRLIKRSPSLKKAFEKKS